MIVKCPRCGLKISTNVRECLCCGFPTNKIDAAAFVEYSPENTSILAPASVPLRSEISETAGVPVETPTEIIQIEEPAAFEPVVIENRAIKRKNTIIVTIGVLVTIALFILGSIYLTSNDSNPDKKVEVAESPGESSVEAEAFTVANDYSEPNAAVVDDSNEKGVSDKAEASEPAASEALSFANESETASAASDDSGSGVAIIEDPNEEGSSDRAITAESSESEASSYANKFEAASSMTMAQKQALATAKDYLDYSAFSYTGLIHQLEFEKFDAEDATYAADNCGADWNEQAFKMAKEYLNYDSYSLDRLIDQLEYEGFTPEQAEYGANEAYKEV